MKKLIQINLCYWKERYPEWDSLSENEKRQRRTDTLNEIDRALKYGQDIASSSKWISVIDLSNSKVIIEEPKWFSHILHDHWKPKNKLAEAIKKMVRENECRVLNSSEELEAYKKELYLKTRQLIYDHPKCDDINMYTEQNDTLCMCYWKGVAQLRILREKEAI